MVVPLAEEYGGGLILYEQCIGIKEVSAGFTDTSIREVWHVVLGVAEQGTRSSYKLVGPFKQ